MHRRLTPNRPLALILLSHPRKLHLHLLLLPVESNLRRWLRNVTGPWFSPTPDTCTSVAVICAINSPARQSISPSLPRTRRPVAPPAVPAPVPSAAIGSTAASPTFA